MQKMCMCKKCTMICGVLFLALGVLFLLVDLGYWDFWGINWWTAVLLVGGVAGLASSKCPDCQAVRTGGMAKKK